MRKTGVLLCLLACPWAAALAQEEDSVVQKKVSLPTVVRWIRADAFVHDTLVSSPVDTVIQAIHLVNKAENHFLAYLANNGSAGDPTLFRTGSRPYTDAHLPGYDWLFRKDNDTRYFKSNKRFSEITYFSGAQKEQAVRILHSQNIVRNWSAGVDFIRGGADGFLLNSESFKTSFDVFSWYHTKNKRYHAIAHVSWEAVKNQVNGGVSSDSLYDHLDLSSRDLQGLSVELSGAENHVRSRIYSLKQFFDLGPSSAFDTGQTAFRHRPQWRLGLSSVYEKYSFAYIDGTHDSDYYKNTYYSDTNADSLFAGDFRNELSLSRFPSQDAGFFARHYYSVALVSQWLEYRQRSIDKNYGNAGFKVAFRSAENDTALQYFFEEEITSATSDGDELSYRILIGAGLPVLSDWNFAVSAELGTYNPPVFFERYYSNHFIREREPQQVSYTHLHFKLASQRIRLELGAHHWKTEQLPYYDAEALPAQFAPAISVIQAYLKKDFTWHNLHFDNTIWFQEADNGSILHLPSWSTYHALYYATPAFKKALYFVAGIDARIQSHFEGNAFMPSTGFFYLQDSIRTGGQVIVNFFFNFKIRTADLFVKYENAGSLLFDNKYYLVPHYPMQGATFKIGLRWRFFDQ